MINTAMIVRDGNNDVYLEIGHPLKKPVYFLIQAYATRPKDNLKKLSKKFNINVGYNPK